MARHFMTYFGNVTLTTENPMTLAIIKAAAQVRAVIRAIEVMPLGATAAQASMLFDLATCTDWGTCVDAAADLRKDLVAAAETAQTTARKYDSAGAPTSPVVIEEFTLHMMAQRQWYSLGVNRELIIPGGTYIAFRKKDATTGFAMRFNIRIEE